MGPMCGQQAADAKSSNAAPGERPRRADGTDGWKPGAADVAMAGRGARGSTAPAPREPALGLRSTGCVRLPLWGPEMGEDATL